MRVVRGFSLSREKLFLLAPLSPGLVWLVALGDRDGASLRGNFSRRISYYLLSASAHSSAM